MDIGVCYLRLDFESFDIQGLSDSKENSDAADQTGTVTECQDKFTVAVCRYEEICSSQLWEFIEEELLYYIIILYRFFLFIHSRQRLAPLFQRFVEATKASMVILVTRMSYITVHEHAKDPDYIIYTFLKILLVVYIDMGQGATDTATLNFDIGSGTYSRFYEIKVTQLPCSSEYQ